jgi:hypothetical protein
MTESTNTFQLLKTLNQTQDEATVVEFDEATQAYSASQCEEIVKHLHSFDSTIPTTNYVVDDNNEIVEVHVVEPIDPATQVGPGDPEASNEVFNIELLSGAFNEPTVVGTLEDFNVVLTTQDVAEVKQVFETPNKKDLKTKRLVEFQKAVEAELQPLLIEANNVNKLIVGAKTKTKKDFYNKKFVKITDQAKTYVATIQQIEALISPEGTDHANTPNTPV